MTEPEAKTIALLRCGHEYSFSKTGLVAREIWGSEWCEEQTGRKGGDSIQGQALISKMEDVLGLQRCQADHMDMREYHCQNCNQSAIYLINFEDDPSRCKLCNSDKGLFG